MLLEIREKVQGLFASIILVFICVLFGLWGIQNYLGGGKESPVVSVGDKEFFQRDVTQAYQQFAQNLAGMKFDEETIKKQAIQKLVSDEVLLQHVQAEKLIVSDSVARDFIQGLEYFQKDGQFDKTQYQSLLASQNMSSDEFVARIKKALVMEQFQKTITDTAFVTPVQVSNFFKIQNQKRDLEYVTIPVTTSSQSVTDEEINSYFQQHQDAFQTDEQVSVQYVELSLDKLAAQVKPTEEQLKAYYQEQKAQFSSKERRRISHILFAFTKDTSADQQALQKAQQAKQALQHKDFATLAAELSDDKLTAKKGGDLGLFNVGVMEKSFEEVAAKLKLGEVSEPVKSAFGYHLIKVTELTAGDEKPFEAVKAELSKAYQKAQAESQFTALGEKLAQVSYEHADSLESAAQVVESEIAKTPLFTRTQGQGIASEEKVRLAAFSEDVLKGNNSEPIEIGNERLVVIRMQAHQPATTKPLAEVKAQVVAALQKDKAQQVAATTAGKIQAELNAGKSFAEVADSFHLAVKRVNGLVRAANDLSPTIRQAVFKAPKPKSGQNSVIVVDDISGAKVVANIVKVTDGEITEEDKAKLPALEKNIATSFGRSQFDAVLNALQAQVDVTIHAVKP